MNQTQNWFEKTRFIITDPQQFFSEHQPASYGEPLKFAAISLIIAGIIAAIRAATLMPVGAEPVIAVLTALIGSVLGGLIALFIGSGIVHIFVYLLGGRQGYQNTFSVAAYVTALAPISAILSIMPLIGSILGLLVSLYSLYIYIKGLENYQLLSTERAAAAVLIPVVILALMALILAAIFFSLALLSPPVTTS